MRSIGFIPPTLDAERFSDHLHAQGMPNMVEESAPGERWIVWVDNEDHLDRAKSELDAYLEHPNDARYAGAVKTAEKARKQQTKKQRRLRERFVDVRTSWGSAKQWATPVTITLILISVAVALATTFGRGEALERVGPYLWFSAGHPVVIDGVPQVTRSSAFHEIRQGQVWRLITPIFIHYGLIHLIFNMFWLRDLGAMIEARKSSLFLLLVVLVCAVIPLIGEVLWDPRGIHAGGMSGVVYGLFGFAWMKGKFQPHEGIGVSSQTIMIMLGWLVFCIIGEDLIGRVANAAHVVGLVVGVCIGYAPTLSRRAKRVFAR